MGDLLRAAGSPATNQSLPALGVVQRSYLAPSSLSQVKGQDFGHPQPGGIPSCPGAVPGQRGCLCAWSAVLPDERGKEGKRVQRQKDGKLSQETHRDITRQKYKEGDRRGEQSSQRRKTGNGDKETEPEHPPCKPLLLVMTATCHSRCPPWRPGQESVIG